MGTYVENEVTLFEILEQSEIKFDFPRSLLSLFNNPLLFGKCPTQIMQHGCLQPVINAYLLQKPLNASLEWMFHI